MEKYYKPDIENLRIGYECEINHSRGYSKEYIPTIIGYKDEESAYTHELTNIIHMIDDGYGEVRTPYLTKEQIIAEGWKLEKFQINPNRIAFKKDNLFIILDTTEEVPWLDIILRDPSRSRHTINPEKFHTMINCPSINEFRQIIKLLHI
jgi:hypothetical protein